MFRWLLFVTAVLHFTTSNTEAVCGGNYECALCTVTGPSVIDINGQVNSVTDRCTYTLMKTSGFPSLEVNARFKERRRRDVSFLDSVILAVDGQSVSIDLEQGGRVQVNNTEITLSAAPQTVLGLKLSKDRAGVTASVTENNNTFTVFFDGYTAQLEIRGPTGQLPTVEGLCGNSSKSLSESRLSDNSTIGCETLYNDTADSTINCNKTTERCNLLKDSVFTPCHASVGPDPHVSACTNALCTYPEVDALDCQFLEAYARACSLYNITMDGWRSMANCSSEPQAFCQDRYCSAHEFCGEKSNSNETRCHCRAIFASPYRSNNSMADAVECNDNSGSVAMYGCLLEESGISYSDLHLYDSSCRGEMDNVIHMFTLGSDADNPCGTMVKINDEQQLVNKNGVMLETTDEEILGITCPFVIPDVDIDFSMDIQFKSGSSSNDSVAYVTTGEWNYTVTLKAFIDSKRTHTVTNTTMLKLNQRVWFELKASPLNDSMVALVTKSCFTTNQPSPNTSLTYDLIINGCPNPADKTVLMESNGEGTSNYFSLQMFRFVGKTPEVYMHCRVVLCPKDGDSCVQNCNQASRRRRSLINKYENEYPVTVTTVWGY